MAVRGRKRQESRDICMTRHFDVIMERILLE